MSGERSALNKLIEKVKEQRAKSMGLGKGDIYMGGQKDSFEK